MGLIPGREDPLEEEMVTYSSIVAWKIPWTEEPGGQQSMGLQSWTWLCDWAHKLLVQFSSVAQSCSTFCDPMNCSTPGLPLSITNSRSPPKLISIKSVMLSNHLILCRPLLLLPSIFPSIRVFSNESALCISLCPSTLQTSLARKAYSQVIGHIGYNCHYLGSF